MSESETRAQDGDARDALFDVSNFGRASVDRSANIGAISAVSATALRIVIQFGAVAAISRLVPPEEFGVAAMALPIVTVLSGLAHFGLALPIIQRPTVSHSLASTLFWVNVALSLTVVGVILLLGPAAATFYDEPRVTPVFAGLAAAVLLSSCTVQHFALIRRQMRFRTMDGVYVAAELISAAAGVGSALAGASYWAVVIQQIVMHGVTLSCLLALTRWTPSPPPLNAQAWREAASSIGFGGYYAVYGLSVQTTQGLGAVISGRVFGEVGAGVYQRAATLSSYPEIKFAGALAGVFITSLSRLLETPEAFRALHRRILIRMDLLLMPVGALLLTSGDSAVRLLLGPDWSAAGPALSWLGLVTLAAPMNSTLNWAMTAAGSARLLMIHGVFSVIAILAALIYASGYGLTTMAMAHGLTALFVLVPAIAVLAMRGSPLQIGRVMRRYLYDLCVTGVAIAAVLALRDATAPDPGLISMLLCGGALGVFYLAFILIDPELRADARAALLQVAGILRRIRGVKTRGA